MKFLNLKIYNISLSEIVFGLLIIFLTIVEAGAIYQIKILKSEYAKYRNQGVQSLVDVNLRFLHSTQDITRDHNFYNLCYLNKDRPNFAKYCKANFSALLTAAIIRSEKQPFDVSLGLSLDG